MQGFCGHSKRVCTESWLWEKKSLAALGNRTCLSSVPVRHSTNWATSLPPKTCSFSFDLNVIIPWKIVGGQKIDWCPCCKTVPLFTSLVWHFILFIALHKIQQAHKDLLIIEKRCKLQWYEHVSCSSGLVNTILQGTVKGGRRQGRQNKRWEDNTREW